MNVSRYTPFILKQSHIPYIKMNRRVEEAKAYLKMSISARYNFPMERYNKVTKALNAHCAVFTVIIHTVQSEKEEN